MYKNKANTRLRLFEQFLHSKSKLTLYTKLNLYKLLVKSVRTYGIQIRESAKISNLNKIQITQNKFFGLITNTLLHVTNQTLHSDLQMKTIKPTTKNYYTRYRNSLINHPNILWNQLLLLIPGNPLKRLKKENDTATFSPHNPYIIDNVMLPQL